MPQLYLHVDIDVLDPAEAPGVDYPVAGGLRLDELTRIVDAIGFGIVMPVLPQLLNRAPATISLALGASIIWLLAGVATGVLSALKRGSLWDRGAMTIALSRTNAPELLPP